MAKKYVSIFFGLLLILMACRHEKDGNNVVSGPSTETLIKINQYLVKEDADRIMKVAERRGWELKMHGSGLFYQIIEHGHGAKPKSGDRVTFIYKSELLSGDLCYSSDSTGPKSFRIDKSTIETGWNELAKELTLGDSVLMVLPPFLGAGLAGDGKKIPARSIVVYHMRMIDIETAD